MSGPAKTMKFALQVVPDLQAAHEAVREFAGDIDDVGAAADRAQRALDKIDTNGLGAAGSTADTAATGLKREAESAEEAAARIKEVVRASLEYQRQAQAQIAADQALAEASRDVTEVDATRVQQSREARQAAYESQAAVTAQIRSIGELSQAVDAGVRSRQELAARERDIDAAMRAGLLTESEQLEMLGKLDKAEKQLQISEKQLQAAQERSARQVQGLVRLYDPASGALAKLAADEDRLKKAVDQGTISREQYNRALVGVWGQRMQWVDASEGVRRVTGDVDRLKLSAREVRTSLASITTQLAQGNTAGAGSGLLSLGTRGIAGLGAAGVAIGGLAAAIGLVVTAAYQGYEQNRQFELGLISTGNTAGVTAGQLADMRNEIADATGEYGKAQVAVDGLARSGKYSGEMLKTASNAAFNLSELTGESIDQTTAKIIRLAEAPSAMLVELNKQYHFLTGEVLEHVQALEKQGRTTDAVREALNFFATVHEQRVQQARETAGTLERAWLQVKSAIAGAWQAMKDYGRGDVDARLKRAKDDLAQFQEILGSWGFVGDHERARKGIAQTKALIASLEAQKTAEEDLAAGTAFANELREEGLKATKDTLDALEASRTKAEQYADAVKKVAERYQTLRRNAEAANRDDPLLVDVVFKADGSISGGGYDKEVAALKQRYKEAKTPKGPKSEAQKDQDAAKRELENLQRQAVLVGQIEDGRRKASDAARIEHEINQGAYKLADEALKQQLVDAAQLLDSERLRAEAAEQLKDVHLQIAAIQGREDVQTAKGRIELERLQQYLQNMGRESDAADVGKLLGLKQAQQELLQLRRTYDQTMGQISLEQQRIQVELQAGLITEGEAQQRIVDLYRQKLGTLRDLVPQMRAAAEAMGDPKALAAVEEIDLKLQEMAATTNLLQQTVRSTLQGAFKDALLSLNQDGASLDGLVRNFIGSMATGMAEWAAEQLSQAATNALMSKVGDWLGDIGSIGTDAAAAAATQAAAASLTAAGTAVTAGGTTVTTGAAALGTSSATLGAAGGTLITGAAAVQVAAAQLQAAAASMMAANAMRTAASFAYGGYTGPGGKFQYAGIVHKGEGVLTQEEISLLGGPSGFFALRAAIRNGFAEGGLVAAAPVIARPQIAFSPAEQLGPQVNVDSRSRIYVLSDREELARYIANHPAIEKKIVVVSGENGQAIQGEWQQ